MGIWIVPMNNNYLIWGVVNAYENSLLICITCLILRFKINSMLCGVIGVCKNHLFLSLMFSMLWGIIFMLWGFISVCEKHNFNL